MGVSFQFRHPKDARACNRPQSGQRPVDRHKEFPSLWKHCSWGCSIICKNMVPFHDLWTDGGETEKRPPCPPRVTEPAQTYGSYFWDTTLVSRIVIPETINPAIIYVIPAPRFRGGRLREAPLHYSGINSKPESSNMLKRLDSPMNRDLRPARSSSRCSVAGLRAACPRESGGPE